MMQDDHTDHDIGDHESEGQSEDTRETTLSSDMEQEDLDHQQQVLHLGQAHRHKSSRTARVPLPMKRSHADTVIVHPLLPNPRKPPWSMAPPLLKHQTSALINNSSGSDDAPSAQALPQPKSSGDQNAQQPKASANQNIPQHQTATFEVAQRFIEAIRFTKTPWPIVSEEKYSMVDEAWQLAIEAHDCQLALAGAPAGTPSVGQ